MLRKWLARLDERYAKPCAYAAITVLVTFCLAIALWHASGLVAVVWDYICLIFGPLIYGATICYLLQPMVRAFSKGLTRRKSLADHEQRRMHLAVILTLIAIVIVLLLIVVFALLIATRGLRGLSRETFQDLLDNTQFDLMAFFNTIKSRLADLGIVTGSSETTMEFFGSVSEIFTAVMLSAVFGTYFLFDGERAARYAHSLLRAIAGDGVAQRVSGFVKDADRVFSGFVRGQFIDAIAVGTLMGIALQIVGIPFAPFIGIIVGVANIIPFAGGPVGYVLVILVCYTEQTTGKLIAGAIAVTVVMFIDGNFISPRLMANTLTFHPMLVLVALVSGSTVGGLPGMLAAVPLFAFLKLKLDEWIELRLARRNAAKSTDLPNQAQDSTAALTESGASAEPQEDRGATLPAGDAAGAGREGAGDVS